MQNNKIIITETEQIFLEFVKSFNIKDIKTSDEIIIGEFSRENEDKEEENIVIIHGKDITKTIDFIKNKYILIEKFFLAGNAEILSNKELISGDIIVPNTFISENGETKFLDNTIGKDYDMNKFGLMLSGICSDNKEEKQEFQADVFSKQIFTYLKALESENLLEKAIVIFQIEKQDNYSNLIAVIDMMI